MAAGRPLRRRSPTRVHLACLSGAPHWIHQQLRAEYSDLSVWLIKGVAQAARVVRCTLLMAHGPGRDWARSPNTSRARGPAPSQAKGDSMERSTSAGLSVFALDLLAPARGPVRQPARIHNCDRPPFSEKSPLPGIEIPTSVQYGMFLLLVRARSLRPIMCWCLT